MIEEIGWASRLMSWLRIVVAVVHVNLLALAGVLVGGIVAGIAPSATAATIVLTKLGSADEHFSVGREYFRAYRAQFWRANRVGWPFLIVGAIAALDVMVVPALAGPMGAVLSAVVLIVGVYALLAALAALTLTASTSSPAPAVWRAALAIPLVSPLTSVLLLASLAVLGLVFAAAPVLTLLCGLSLPLSLAASVIQRRIAALRLRTA